MALRPFLFAILRLERLILFAIIFITNYEIGKCSKNIVRILRNQMNENCFVKLKCESKQSDLSPCNLNAFSNMIQTFMLGEIKQHILS